MTRSLFTFFMVLCCLVCLSDMVWAHPHENAHFHMNDNRAEVKKTRPAFLNHIFSNHEDAVYTLHMAFYSREAAQRILGATVKNTDGFKAGSAVNRVS